MSQCYKRLKPEELAGKEIDFLGTADACRVFHVEGTVLSKMRSVEIGGRDNHRKSPFEKVGDIIWRIRIEIDEGDEAREQAGR